MDKREVEELLTLLREINLSLKLVALSAAVQVAGTRIGQRDEGELLDEIAVEAEKISNTI